MQAATSRFSTMLPASRSFATSSCYLPHSPRACERRAHAFSFSLAIPWWPKLAVKIASVQLVRTKFDRSRVEGSSRAILHNSTNSACDPALERQFPLERRASRRFYKINDLRAKRA
jgi:hypothetical protein